ncbi:MAG: hypothetical protein EBZ48_11315 [Proteobacteria bacterium]|nr:hypothetical protein [Pseudomonadota bacterium]
MRFTEDLFLSALNGDITGLNKVPKAEFHTHLLLSAPLSAYRGMDGTTPASPPERFPLFSDFDRYIFGELIQRLRSPKQIQAVAKAALAQMVESGIVYTETSVDIFAANLAGLPWSELAEILRKECAAVRPWLQVELELGLARGAQPRPWRELAISALRTGIFSGVDLYGEEEAAPVEEYADFFAMAREHDLRVKLHTGEQREAEHALYECRKAAPDAIQHGITGVGDASFLDLVRGRKTPLHICPTSNVRLCLASSYKQHPIRQLYDAGVAVTLNTDDPGIFGQTLSQEYLHLYRSGLFDVAELEAIRMTGLKLAGIEHHENGFTTHI